MSYQNSSNSKNIDDYEGDFEEDYYVPPEDQRGFGAGYRRKRVAFVPAAASDTTVQTQSLSPLSVCLPGDRYLSIVLGDKQVKLSPPPPEQKIKDPLESGTKNESEEGIAERAVQMQTCEICGQPLESIASSGRDGMDTTTAIAMLATSRRTHETSIAHQVCLAHSHPPSHLDREHMGLKYLADYGWDPDARTGLGARQEGIRVPVKAREKRDTAGLGVDTVANEDDLVVVKPKPVVKKEAKVTKVNAKEVRKIEDDKRKRAEKLRQSFYGEDFSKYLGLNG